VSSPLHDLIVERIRSGGPITVAEYMELALYHEDFGYYSTAERRSGREGDFYTSVDVGPLFGELIATQLAELWVTLRVLGADRFDLVEAGASDGRLARDILDAAARDFTDFHSALHVTLVDRSRAAAERQGRSLGPYADRLTTGRCRLPQGITGAIIANELLDALPVHRVVVRNGTLYEVHVAEDDGVLQALELRPSTERITQFMNRLGVMPPEGMFAEVGLAAVEWMADAAAALDRGFLLVFDYGCEARDLYSSRHATGTLTTYRRHVADSSHWLVEPGTSDITSHVNLTSIQNAAVEAGLLPLGVIDQTYFLLSLGMAARLDSDESIDSIRRRLAARTLVMPGGLGSTMKALAFSKNVDSPVLRGFLSGRLT
jgi:SAM-dependent MidA family methyltransferase